MAVRLKVANRKITEIETLVARVGDQRWFAPDSLEHLSDVFAQPVAQAERPTREELVAAATAYFNAIQTEGTPQFVQAPFAPGMKRFENGLQTTNVTSNPLLERHTWSPDLQLERAQYKGTNVMDRRYPVVDVEHGSVLAIATFRRDGADTSTLLLAEIFKVTGGKLREIRAVILNLPNGAGTGWSTARAERQSGIRVSMRRSWRGTMPREHPSRMSGGKRRADVRAGSRRRSARRELGRELLALRRLERHVGHEHRVGALER